MKRKAWCLISAIIMVFSMTACSLEPSITEGTITNMELLEEKTETTQTMMMVGKIFMPMTNTNHYKEVVEITIQEGEKSEVFYLFPEDVEDYKVGDWLNVEGANAYSSRP